MTLVIRAGLLFALALAAPTPAQAITFATGQGTDNAGCGAITAPCRTLQQAVTNTPAGGYVVLQGPADFGPAAPIDKSISIVGERGATIRANAVGDGRFPITIAGAGDVSKIVVRLRGLAIEGAGSGLDGVTMRGGARLEIADCVIRDFQNQDVIFYPNPPLSSTYRSFVSIVDSVMKGPGAGIQLISRAIGVSAFIDGVKAQDTYFGVGLGNQGYEAARAVVTNSAATNSVIAGFGAILRVAPDTLVPPPRGAGIFVVKSLASGGERKAMLTGDEHDVDASDGASSVSRSIITGNKVAGGGSKLTHSYGGNVIRGNGDDTLSQFSLQSLH